MNNGVDIIPSEAQIKEHSRAKARAILGGSAMYLSMPLSEQQSIYHGLVEEEMDKMREKYGMARSMATDSGAEMGYEGYDPGFEGNTQAFTDLVDSVDFPKFVADLLKAVFDANISVMKAQTDSCIKLIKEATKTTADFIKKVKDDDTFANLAETRQDQYNVAVERNADGSGKLFLTDPTGEKVDIEDAEVKRHILEAKINMAKEHRAALREVLLMGVTRLIVDKGEIEAGVEFKVKGTRQSLARHDDQNINTVGLNLEYGGGLFGSLFGGPSGSLNVSNTNIQVNTSEKKTTDDLSATLKGHVKIVFKTDYFKLDNFANMYGDGGIAALKPPTAGGAGQIAAGNK
jgi:hypothetical protein